MVRWVFVALHRQWHLICVVVCQQHVDIGWFKVGSGVHLLVNFYVVVDGVVLLFYFDCAFAFSISMTW